MSEQSEQGAAQETTSAAETQTNLPPDTPIEETGQTKATPQSEETLTVTSLEEPAKEAPAEKYLGRFSSQEEAQSTLDTLEKRLNDSQAHIQQIEQENAFYRSSLTRASQAQAAQPTPQQEATPGAAPASIELTEADREMMAEDPAKFHKERLMPQVQSIAAEAARRGAEKVIGRHMPALDAVQDVVLQREEGVLWGAMEASDKRFKRGDTMSRRIVEGQSKDFMSRFGAMVQAKQVSLAEAYDYIIKASKVERNEYDKTQGIKPAAVSNATTVTKATGVQAVAKTEEERRKIAENLRWRAKLASND